MNVKVNFGDLRVVYVWKNIFALVIVNFVFVSLLSTTIAGSNGPVIKSETVLKVGSVLAWHHL